MLPRRSRHRCLCEPGRLPARPRQITRSKLSPLSAHPQPTLAIYPFAGYLDSPFGRGHAGPLLVDPTCGEDASVRSGQIFESNGVVSADRRSALPSTTPPTRTRSRSTTTEQGSGRAGDHLHVAGDVCPTKYDTPGSSTTAEQVSHAAGRATVDTSRAASCRCSVGLVCTCTSRGRTNSVIDVCCVRLII